MWSRRQIIGQFALGSLAMHAGSTRALDRSCQSTAIYLGGQPAVAETIIDPELPIIDPHQHLWVLPESFYVSRPGQSRQEELQRLKMRRYARYLLDEYLADARSGHNIRATVYMEADPMRPMYRRSGPESLRSLGEVEFANGVAAIAASGSFGETQVCAGIVGYVDLNLGEAAVHDILTTHLQTAPSRYRGVRRSTPSSKIPHVLLDPQFRSGFKCLQKLRLSFDALVFEHELPELIDLARAFPETPIILDHLGMPTKKDRFAIWREDMNSLSRCPNVVVKLGGMGMLGGAEPYLASKPFSSEQLAAQWKPYVETCIEAFGVQRSMFEGNFPMDSATCSYATLWNTFKRISASASADEKHALFSGTAAKVYRLSI